MFNKFILIVLLLQCCIPIVFSHKCKNPHLGQSLSPAKQFLRDLQATIQYQVYNPANGKPIRFQLDYSNLIKTTATQDQINYIESIMSAAQQIYQSILSVNRDTSNLIIPASVTKCDANDIPDYYHTTGVDADIVVFVTAFSAGGKSSNADTLAFGLFCLQSEKTQRPTVGQISFNLNFIVDGRKNFYNDVMTAVHELNHVLAFHDGLYTSYLNNNGYMRQLSEVAATIKFGDTDRLSIITPKVVQIGRDHYNCPTLQGVPLENDGGSGSAGAHWEKTFLHNDYMIADDADNIVISKFSLALFEDSGWYGVDYSYAEQLFWGKNQGCTFVNQTCKTTSINFGQFCSPSNYDFCTFDYTAQGYCAAETFMSKDGCADVLSLRYCYNQSYNNGSEPYDQQTAAKYGPKSKCFMSNVVNLNIGLVSTSKYSLTAFRSQCYEYYCQDNQLYIEIANQKVKCDSYGQIVSLIQANSFNGSIVCPDPSEFCQQATNVCPNACSGKGYCHNGKCICKDQYMVYDCNMTQDQFDSVFQTAQFSMSNLIAQSVSSNQQTANSGDLYSLEFDKSQYISFGEKLQIIQIILGIIFVLSVFM